MTDYVDEPQYFTGSGPTRDAAVEEARSEARKVFGDPLPSVTGMREMKAGKIPEGSFSDEPQEPLTWTVQFTFDVRIIDKPAEPLPDDAG